LFQGGRGDIIEKYLESFDHWHRAGWAVTAFDWRGQGGSGRLAADPLVGHAESFEPWIEDLADFYAHWQAEHAGPHVVMGHSMGGHLVLRALAERRITPDAAVLIAPMLGLHSKPFTPRIARRLAHFMTRIGRPERLAWKSNERPSAPNASREAFLTHDPARYADELWWKAHQPELALGPPSWRWVAAAYDSTLAMEAPGIEERITTPILILAASADKLVDIAAIRRAADRLPDSTLHVYGSESAHEILREADRVRTDALDRIDAFLSARVPAP
jgi:lysophospholipase